MKKNNLIVFSLVLSVILLVIAATLYLVTSDETNEDTQKEQVISSNEEDTKKEQTGSNDGIETDTSELTDENLADEIESEKKSKDNIKSTDELNKEFDTEIRSSMTTYIKGRYAPQSEEDFNKAISMHSQEVIDKNNFDYQELHENSYALNEEKSIEDINISINEVDNEKLKGTYSFVLVVQLSDTTERVDHKGEFKLETYDNGYFYLSKFGDDK